MPITRQAINNLCEEHLRDFIDDIISQDYTGQPVTAIQILEAVNAVTGSVPATVTAWLVSRDTARQAFVQLRILRQTPISSPFIQGNQEWKRCDEETLTATEALILGECIELYLQKEIQQLKLQAASFSEQQQLQQANQQLQAENQRLQQENLRMRQEMLEERRRSEAQVQVLRTELSSQIAAASAAAMTGAAMRMNAVTSVMPASPTVMLSVQNLEVLVQRLHNEAEAKKLTVEELLILAKEDHACLETILYNPDLRDKLSETQKVNLITQSSVRLTKYMRNSRAVGVSPELLLSAVNQAAKVIPERLFSEYTQQLMADLATRGRIPEVVSDSEFMCNLNVAQKIKIISHLMTIEGSSDRVKIALMEIKPRSVPGEEIFDYFYLLIANANVAKQKQEIVTLFEELKTYSKIPPKQFFKLLRELPELIQFSSKFRFEESDVTFSIDELKAIGEKLSDANKNLLGYVIVDSILPNNHRAYYFPACCANLGWLTLATVKKLEAEMLQAGQTVANEKSANESFKERLFLVTVYQACQQPHNLEVAMYIVSHPALLNAFLPKQREGLLEVCRGESNTAQALLSQNREEAAKLLAEAKSMAKKLADKYQQHYKNDVPAGTKDAAMQLSDALRSAESLTGILHVLNQYETFARQTHQSKAEGRFFVASVFASNASPTAYDIFKNKGTLELMQRRLAELGDPLSTVRISASSTATSIAAAAAAAAPSPR